MKQSDLLCVLRNILRSLKGKSTASIRTFTSAWKAGKLPIHQTATILCVGYKSKLPMVNMHG